MDPLPEADSYRALSCGAVEVVRKLSSGQYIYRFLKIVNLIHVRLETVELGPHPCS
jgi:hypothetical protein